MFLLAFLGFYNPCPSFPRSQNRQTRVSEVAGQLTSPRFRCVDVTVSMFSCSSAASSSALSAVPSSHSTALFSKVCRRRSGGRRGNTGITDTLIASEANYTTGALDLDVFRKDVLHYCLMYFLIGLVLFCAGYLSVRFAFSPTIKGMLECVSVHPV